MELDDLIIKISADTSDFLTEVDKAYERIGLLDRGPSNLYAYKFNNVLFNGETAAFDSLVKGNNISLESQIRWWQDAMERYKDDYNAVMKCNEKVFALTRKLVDNVNSVSDIYIDTRTYFNDWDEYGDNAIACFERIRDRNQAVLESGIITYDEFVDNVSSAGKRLYDGRIEQSENWLKQQLKYNNMSYDEYIAGLERMAQYTEEYFNNGLISYREYCEGLKSINNDIYDAVKVRNNNEYDAWKKDAKGWQTKRTVYDDWDEYNDSFVKFYERSIERVKEFYDAGKIDWQTYMDDVAYYQMELYKAQMDEVDALLEKEKKYISNLKSQYAKEESDLKASWEEEDRRGNIADVNGQLSVYKYAVTEKGRAYYEELQTQLKQLKRQEELAQLEAEHNEIIERLESRYEKMEANKKGLLTSIKKYGLDTNDMVGTIVYDVAGMKYSVVDKLSDILTAVRKCAKVSTKTYNNNSSQYYSIASSSYALSGMAAAVAAQFYYK